MNIVLVGKAGSGKTAIRDWISENLRYDKIISYTTREKRKEEVDGRDYFFVDDKWFDKNDICLYTIRTVGKYGILKKDIENASFRILIVDVAGLREINNLENHSQFVSFYIDAPDEQRFRRCCNRGDSPMITRIRMEEEDKEFGGIKTDYKIDNSDGKFDDAILSILIGVKEVNNCLLRGCTQ